MKPLGRFLHPSQICPNKIIETLGEGGMEVVYLAEQQQPLRRRVALKVIKLGIATREVKARAARPWRSCRSRDRSDSRKRVHDDVVRLDEQRPERGSHFIVLVTPRAVGPQTRTG